MQTVLLLGDNQGKHEMGMGGAHVARGCDYIPLVHAPNMHEGRERGTLAVWAAGGVCDGSDQARPWQHGPACHRIHSLRLCLCRCAETALLRKHCWSTTFKLSIHEATPA